MQPVGQTRRLELPGAAASIDAGDTQSQRAVIDDHPVARIQGCRCAVQGCQGPPDQQGVVICALAAGDRALNGIDIVLDPVNHRQRDRCQRIHREGFGSDGASIASTIDRCDSNRLASFAEEIDVCCCELVTPETIGISGQVPLLVFEAQADAGIWFATPGDAGLEGL